MKHLLTAMILLTFVGCASTMRDIEDLTAKEYLYQNDSKEYYCTTENQRGYGSETRIRAYTELNLCKKSVEIIKQTNERKAKELKAEKARIKEIKSFVKKNPKYERFEKTAIDKKISIGMPFDLMVSSWGYPSKINKSVYSFGVYKQCIYYSTYVYIQNNLITSWQNMD